LKGAIEDFTTSIALNPNEKDAFLGRGLSKQDLADYDGALKDLNKAVSMDPAYGKAYSLRGQVKLLKGDILGACNDLLKAQKLGYSPPMAAFKEHCN
jgi:tetratricopeptide (TPR) repeat protein